LDNFLFKFCNALFQLCVFFFQLFYICVFVHRTFIGQKRTYTSIT
jgi:hypothetical protein